MSHAQSFFITGLCRYDAGPYESAIRSFDHGSHVFFSSICDLSVYMLVDLDEHRDRICSPESLASDWRRMAVRQRFWLGAL